MTSSWPAFCKLQQYDISQQDAALALSGFSGTERWGRWTLGHTSVLQIPYDQNSTSDLVVLLDMQGHIHRNKVDRQIVRISRNGEQLGEWTIEDVWFRIKGIRIPREKLTDGAPLTLTIEVPNAFSSSTFGLSEDKRVLGIGMKRMWVGEIADSALADKVLKRLDVGRFVGEESRKTYDTKVLEGFWDAYMDGPNVLDIGFSSYGDPRVVPITPTAIGVDIDYPGYDGRTLPFKDGSQDTVYSSHCLEHIPDAINAIRDWHRVTKTGGYIVIAVPSRDLYERSKKLPSLWNQEHLRLYTPAALMAEVESALAPNTFKVRYLKENDSLYDYSLSPDKHPQGIYEITAVLQKINKPEWDLIE